MRWLKCGVVMLVGFCPAMSQAGPVTLFQTGFEMVEQGNDFPGWGDHDEPWRVVASTAGAYSGVRSARLSGPTLEGGSELWVSLSSAGLSDVSVAYAFDVKQGLEPGEFVSTFWSGNGGASWELLETITGPATDNWQISEFTLPAAADDNNQLVFMIGGVLGSTSDEVAIDNVWVTAVPEPATLVLISVGSLILFRRQFPNCLAG